MFGTVFNTGKGRRNPERERDRERKKTENKYKLYSRCVLERDKQKTEYGAERIPSGAGTHTPSLLHLPLGVTTRPVSYTHLDVYKRQHIHRVLTTITTHKRGSRNIYLFS